MYEIKYCPRCGRLYTIISTCECEKELSLFSKERKKCKLISSGIDQNDWPDYHYAWMWKRKPSIAEDEGYPFIPSDKNYFTQSMYEYFWENFIDIPENNRLNREEFEANKQRILSIMEEGGTKFEPAVKLSYDPNAKSQKDASVIGRGVAGGLVAGPVGAVVGALSAVDKNNRNRK